MAGSGPIAEAVEVPAASREPVQGLTGCSRAVRTHCVGRLLNIAEQLPDCVNGQIKQSQQIAPGELEDEERAERVNHQSQTHEKLEPIRNQ